MERSLRPLRRIVWISALLGALALVPLAMSAGPVSYGGGGAPALNGAGDMYEFANGTVADAAEVNDNFVLLHDAVNETLAMPGATQSGFRIYSARIEYVGNAPVIDAEYGDWLNGNPTDDAVGRSTVNFNNGIFCAKPTIIVSTSDTGASYYDTLTVSTAVTTTSVKVDVRNHLANAFTDAGYTILAIGPNVCP